MINPGYRKRKVSRIEWLESIPDHWEEKRLKFHGRLQVSNVDKKSVEGQEAVKLCNYTDVYKNERIVEGMEFMDATASESQRKRFGLQKGDVLFTKDSEDPADIAVPALVSEDLEGVLCGYHLAMLRPDDEATGRYIDWAMRAPAMASHFQVEAKGVTRFGLDSKALGGGWFPAPFLEERAKIADFLDRETAKIDALIAEKRKVMKLLEAKRKAVINRAVTKGLNPDVKMKDSGVPWIGEIPGHWELKRLKFLLSEPLAYGANASGEAVNNEGLRFVRITDIDAQGRLKSTDVKYLPGRTGEGYRLEAEDILLARSGATVGKTFQYQPSWGPCCFAGYLIRCRVNPEQTSAGFLYYFTKTHAYDAWKATVIIKATIENISAEKYANLPVPTPPVGEQRQILKLVGEVNSSIDNLLASVESNLAELQTRRTALITAAVTGQIDVRDGTWKENTQKGNFEFD